MWQELTFQNFEWTLAPYRRNSWKTQHWKTFLRPSKTLFASRNPQRSSDLPSLPKHHAKERKKWRWHQTPPEIRQTWVHWRKRRWLWLSEELERCSFRWWKAAYGYGKIVLPQTNFRHPWWMYKCCKYGLWGWTVQKGQRPGHNSVHSNPQKFIVQVPWL